MTAPRTLAQQVDAILEAEVRAIADLASGERAAHTLTGTITGAHDRFVAASAAQHALRTVRLRDRDASALDAVTPPELSQALDVLAAVRVTVACVSGGSSAKVVSDMQSAAGKLLEAELAPAAPLRA